MKSSELDGASMPTKSIQYSFDELVRALLRAQGIEEGRWAFSMQFTTTAAALTPNESFSIPVPALVVSITGGTLTRVEDPNVVGIDASELS